MSHSLFGFYITEAAAADLKQLLENRVLDADSMITMHDVIDYLPQYLKRKSYDASLGVWRDKDYNKTIAVHQKMAESSSDSDGDSDVARIGGDEFTMNVTAKKQILQQEIAKNNIVLFRRNAAHVGVDVSNLRAANYAYSLDCEKDLEGTFLADENDPTLFESANGRGRVDALMAADLKFMKSCFEDFMNGDYQFMDGTNKFSGETLLTQDILDEFINDLQSRLLVRSIERGDAFLTHTKQETYAGLTGFSPCFYGISLIDPKNASFDNSKSLDKTISQRKVKHAMLNWRDRLNLLAGRGITLPNGQHFKASDNTIQQMRKVAGKNILRFIRNGTQHLPEDLIRKAPMQVEPIIEPPKYDKDQAAAVGHYIDELPQSLIMLKECASDAQRLLAKTFTLFSDNAPDNKRAELMEALSYMAQGILPLSNSHSFYQNLVQESQINAFLHTQRGAFNAGTLPSQDHADYAALNKAYGNDDLYFITIGIAGGANLNASKEFQERSDTILENIRTKVLSPCANIFDDKAKISFQAGDRAGKDAFKMGIMVRADDVKFVNDVVNIALQTGHDYLKLDELNKLDGVRGAPSGMGLLAAVKKMNPQKGYASVSDYMTNTGEIVAAALEGLESHLKKTGFKQIATVYVDQDNRLHTPQLKPVGARYPQKFTQAPLNGEAVNMPERDEIVSFCKMLGNHLIQRAAQTSTEFQLLSLKVNIADKPLSA